MDKDLEVPGWQAIIGGFSVFKSHPVVVDVIGSGHYFGHDFAEFSDTKSVKSAALSGLARPWLTDCFLPI